MRITPGAKRFQGKAGSDGEYTRYKIGDASVTITLIFMQSSSGNVFLSTAHQIDLASENGAGIGPFAAFDLNGLSVCIDPEAFITGMPESEYAAEVGTREWEIICPNPTHFQGGN